MAPPQIAVPHADFTRCDPHAATLLAERWARRHQVVPIIVEHGALILATADPLDLDAERALGFATGHRITWELATAEQITLALDRVYGEATNRRDPVAPPVEVQHLGFASEAASPDTASAEVGATIIRLVDQILAEAIGAGASDLHLEPEEQGIAVRHRIDGVLRHVRVLPRSVGSPLVSRVKILSGLDIADRMRPQDGRARVAVSGTVVDLRVSTLPVSHGEKIVIRVLDGSAGLRTLEVIGFGEGEMARIRSLLEQREGLILVTGPTGSGKTTTLYAALREIQQRGVNIVTVEDPIEYRLAGVVQVQVHEKAGLTFATALRSIVRQDPDVILVGEIRDRETAEIAIQASLTGHLVLSTLHTNDAASAVTRLVDIGIPPIKIATAVKGVVAQRLVRRACQQCFAAGCDACEGTGFRGRRAIAEILLTSQEFERRVAAGATTEAIADAARSTGALTLWESGMALVGSGDTTLDELRRVAAEPAHSENHQSALPPQPASPPHSPNATVARLNIGTVEVHAVSLRDGAWRVLCLQRGNDTRCPGSWEVVHGRIEDGEEPEDAALRELREETGLSAQKLYSVRVHPFYLHRIHTIEVSVVFAAFVDDTAPVTCGPEHVRAEWVTDQEALARLFWPGDRTSLRELLSLLADGTGGVAEDALRIS